LPLVWWTMAGRGRGWSTTWTALPPSTAPPAAQAHNLAIAILTDIATHPVPSVDDPAAHSRRKDEGLIRSLRRMPKTGERASALTTMGLGNARQMAFGAASVPFEDKGGRGVNGGGGGDAARSFARRAESCRDSGDRQAARRSAERQICHASPRKWRVIFSPYLSDLFCPFVARIGALGLRPTYSRTTRGRQLGFAGGRGLRV
jgi:hypothetical protein